MTRPMFSPANVVAIVVLALLTAWAIGIFAGNAAPTTSQSRQFDQACAMHAMPCAPGRQP